MDWWACRPQRRHPQFTDSTMPCTGSKRAPWVRESLSLGLISATLTACAVGPTFHTPAPPATTHYTPGEQPHVTVEAPGRAGKSQTFIADRDIPADWWT